MPRRPFTLPRGICAHCGREAALMSDGRIHSRHYPCAGAGLLPKALADERTATGTCRHCHAPVPLGVDGKTARHKEQVVTATGWADGYDGCKGSGWTPKPEIEEN